ncbi:hypothetical protein [Bradyrhizobium commune]|uniref:Uncharacterized protein n=1 Tax=Bradyrhizobium commune TaxID=83627 RepID=A0A7S9DBP5_9BRAD|nr:hypothetical protein [Bradyrhizobium commune]QPF94751.1 hypothetical protein IC761_16395 [Bradyrhizobium commune]
MQNEVNPKVNPFGSRATFVMNVCALVLACVVLTEVAVIENQRFGHALPSDPFLCFFPALIMFVVRSEPFSFFFLLAHLLVSVRLTFPVFGIAAGTYKFSRADDPLFILVLFTMATAICFVAFVFVALIRFLVAHRRPAE